MTCDETQIDKAHHVTSCPAPPSGSNSVLPHPAGGRGRRRETERQRGRERDRETERERERGRETERDVTALSPG